MRLLIYFLSVLAACGASVLDTPNTQFIRQGGTLTGNGAGLTNLNGSALSRNTLWTNNAQTWYLLTNATLGTYIAWIPGVGLVKSNTVTGAATLIVGTNGGAHYGGWTPAGAGNVIADGSVTASNFIGNGSSLTNLNLVGNGLGITNVNATNVAGTFPALSFSGTAQPRAGGPFSNGGSPKSGNVRIGDVSTLVASNSIIGSTNVFNYFPGIARLPNGHLLVTYSGSIGKETVDSQIFYTTSPDMGNTWTSQQLIFGSGDSSVGCIDPFPTLLRNGNLVVTFFEYTATVNTNIVIVTGTPSASDTITWIRTNTIGLDAGFYANLITVGGNILEMQNGNLIMPIYGKHSSGSVSTTAILTSTNKGNTWSGYVEIATNGTAQFSECGIVQHPNGTLVAMIRTTDTSPTTNYYARTISVDNGLTWSTPSIQFPLPGGGGQPQLCLLGSGGLVLMARMASPLLLGYSTSWDYGTNWSAITYYGSPQQNEYAGMTLMSDGSISAIIASMTGANTNAWLRYENFRDGFGLFDGGAADIGTLRATNMLISPSGSLVAGPSSNLFTIVNSGGTNLTQISSNGLLTLSPQVVTGTATPYFQAYGQNGGGRYDYGETNDNEIGFNAYFAGGQIKALAPVSYLVYNDNTTFGLYVKHGLTKGNNISYTVTPGIAEAWRAHTNGNVAFPNTVTNGATIITGGTTNSFLMTDTNGTTVTRLYTQSGTLYSSASPPNQSVPVEEYNVISGKTITTGIDGTVIGNTTLYTVPTGRQLIVQQILIIPTTVTALVTPPTLSIGKTAASYVDVIAAGAVTGLTAVNTASILAPIVGATVLQAGDVLTLRVSVGAVGTSYTFKAIVIGVLL